MSGTVEITGAGLILRDSEGQTVARVTMGTAPGEGVLIINAAGPVEAVLPLAELKQFSEVMARAYRTVLFGGVGDTTPRVPRIEHPRAPHLPS